MNLIDRLEQLENMLHLLDPNNQKDMDLIFQITEEMDDIEDAIREWFDNWRPRRDRDAMMMYDASGGN